MVLVRLYDTITIRDNRSGEETIMLQDFKADRKDANLLTTICMSEKTVT